MANWWVDEQGRNNLCGVPGDPTNPTILEDLQIVEFLLTIPQAQIDFSQVVGTLLPAEQARLRALVEANPRTLLPIVPEQTHEERFRRKMNEGYLHDPNRRR